MIAWKRPLLSAICTALLVLAGGVALLTVRGGPTTPGSGRLGLAADIGQFDPGNIISDGNFFDSGALTASDIASFIATKGKNCTTGADGTPCLKDFRQDTPTRTGDGYCPGTYQGGSQEPAATIVAKVAQACGISPKVLLVLLQKEQGLVTSSGGANLSASRYQKATGMGCPDTASCDTQYYGFFNQVYGAAKQYQRYARNPTYYAYQAGGDYPVLYNPAVGCGSSIVHIDNQATAGLYNYTPYQPNAAALAAGYGSGDSCSAYGNRNFWLYYNDWFGSSTVPAVSGGIAVVWNGQGGASGWLGQPVTVMACGLAGGGCAQHFQGGSVYWTATTGAHFVRGAVRDLWASTGWQTGTLGYPTIDTVCNLAGGGCAQHFQGGSVYWSSATGAHVMSGPVRDRFWSSNAQDGVLGYPVTDLICGLAAGGCAQHFQGGSVYWTATTGAHVVRGAVRDLWGSTGWQTGTLGYPTIDTVCGLTGGGCAQHFQGGSVYWSSATGAHVMSGPVRDKFWSSNAQDGVLGYPVSDPTCGLAGGGCAQHFQGGAVYWTAATAAHLTTGALRDAWAASGWQLGPLGYPTDDGVCGAGGCRQAFQGGFAAGATATTVHILSGGIASLWQASGAGTGPLGYPTAEMTCGQTRNGCVQKFQTGLAAWSPSTGVALVTGDLLTTWTGGGAQAGTLGYPTADALCDAGGCSQPFEGGMLATSHAWGTHRLSGGIRWLWTSTGRQAGRLGYPIIDMVCGLRDGGCAQHFQGGSAYWSPRTGVVATWSPIRDAWAAAGWEHGYLGYPSADPACGLRDGGCTQQFQGGQIGWSTATGPHAVSGGFSYYWSGQGREAGGLGYPAADMVCTSAGCTQQFQGGTLSWDRATQVITRR